MKEIGEILYDEGIWDKDSVIAACPIGWSITGYPGHRVDSFLKRMDRDNVWMGIDFDQSKSHMPGLIHDIESGKIKTDADFVSLGIDVRDLPQLLENPKEVKSVTPTRTYESHYMGYTAPKGRELVRLIKEDSDVRVESGLKDTCMLLNYPTEGKIIGTGLVKDPERLVEIGEIDLFYSPTLHSLFEFLEGEKAEKVEELFKIFGRSSKAFAAHLHQMPWVHQKLGWQNYELKNPPYLSELKERFKQQGFENSEAIYNSPKYKGLTIRIVEKILGKYSDFERFGEEQFGMVETAVGKLVKGSDEKLIPIPKYSHLSMYFVTRKPTQSHTY